MLLYKYIKTYMKSGLHDVNYYINLSKKINKRYIEEEYEPFHMELVYIEPQELLNFALYQDESYWFLHLYNRDVQLIAKYIEPVKKFLC